MAQGCSPPDRRLRSCSSPGSKPLLRVEGSPTGLKALEASPTSSLSYGLKALLASPTDRRLPYRVEASSMGLKAPLQGRSLFCGIEGSRSLFCGIEGSRSLCYGIEVSPMGWKALLRDRRLPGCSSTGSKALLRDRSLSCGIERPHQRLPA